VYKRQYLATRFAAKEAFGKALGLGVRAPATLTAIAVAHDAYGKPEFRFAPALAAYMAENGLRAHLSLSDEREYAVAFVVVEKA
jgi:holo-[acyl-carrier protein] synthase